MANRFSSAYPTRDLPHFLAQALGFLERQRYRNFELVVAVSQGGETFDTLQAVRKAKQHGARAHAVCDRPQDMQGAVTTSLCLGVAPGILTPLRVNLAGQLAHHAASGLDRPSIEPRNLARSVTVA